MANRRAGNFGDGQWTGSSPSKRFRATHVVSESDFSQDDEDYDDFPNPDTFLNQFGGYESADSEDPDDDEIEEEPRPKQGSSHGQKWNGLIRLQKKKFTIVSTLTKSLSRIR
jgi:hypothetical protein